MSMLVLKTVCLSVLRSIDTENQLLPLVEITPGAIYGRGRWIVRTRKGRADSRIWIFRKICIPS
jgi:hypothetical protein